MAEEEFAAPPTQVVPFNVVSESYATFMSNLRVALAGKSPEMVKERPVLDKQTGENAVPPRWIHVELKDDGAASPKVAIRSDNAYIVGFTNKDGKWLQLSPKGSAKVVDANAEMLGFNGHYQTLVGGVNNLTELDLARASTADAAQALWYYKPGKAADAGDGDSAVAADPQAALKRKLAILAVVLCEAARLEPVFGAVDRGWQNEKNSITNSEVAFIKNWGDLSTAMLAWKKDKYKNDDKHFKKFNGMGVSTGANAVAKVRLLLNKPPKMGLLAWLKHLWGLLMEMKKKPQHQEEKNYHKSDELEKNQKSKSSASVNPL